jgi:hypothetical protein
MAQIYFLVMVVGVPLGLLAIAVIAACFHRGGYAEILDWKPTRSPEREAELQLSDVAQMLAAQNRYRRQRGAPERTLEEVTEHAWALLPTSHASVRPTR